jgi:serine/threonine-protein kinase HipA
VNPAQLFETLHRGLPQQAPGSDASTLRALARVPDLPPAPEILDLGCGPGRQTLALARATQGRVTAVDLAPEFLAELEARARTSGLLPRVQLRCRSIDALDFAPASFDLVWSEGALYTVGFSRALTVVRPLLRRGGTLAASELSWLVDDPPARARSFWAQAYPAMTTRAGNRRAIEAAGYAPLEDFALPASDWWDGYYGHLLPRIAALRAQCAGDADALALLAGAEEEIGLYRAHGDAYGYVFYLMRRSDERAPG